MAATPQPAVWMLHMVQVQLHDLPKNYSCYDLWYRFREVLQKIGARPDWKITTQGCVFSGNTQARSFSDILEFSTWKLPEQAVNRLGIRSAELKEVDVEETIPIEVKDSATRTH